MHFIPEHFPFYLLTAQTSFLLEVRLAKTRMSDRSHLRDQHEEKGSQEPNFFYLLGSKSAEIPVYYHEVECCYKTTLPMILFITSSS